MNDDELDGLLDSMDGLAELLDEWVDVGMDDHEFQQALEMYSDILPVALDEPLPKPTAPQHVPTGLCAVFPYDEYATSCAVPRPWMGRTPQYAPAPSGPARTFANDIAALREAQARIEHAFDHVTRMGVFASAGNV